jgi:AAA ATPase domain
MKAPASEVLVGRVRELGLLGRALDAAQAGSGTTALVAGEAGIGTTRLASELAAHARDAGFEVLLGRSIDLVGTELPYQPFVEACARSDSFDRSTARRSARSCGCSRRRWRCSASAPPPRRSCWYWRTCTGRHLDP